MVESTAVRSYTFQGGLVGSFISPGIDTREKGPTAKWGGGVQTDTHRDAAALYSTIVLCICSYIIGVRYGE